MKTIEVPLDPLLSRRLTGSRQPDYSIPMAEDAGGLTRSAAPQSWKGTRDLLPGCLEGTDEIAGL